MRVNPLGDADLLPRALEDVTDVSVAELAAVQGAEQSPAAEAKLAAIVGPALQDGQGAVVDADRPGLAALAVQDADRARAVSVVGNFNEWNPFAHPLRRRANRIRGAAVTVQAGTTLHFRQLAEGGVWFDDESMPAQGGQGVALTV